MLLNSAIKQISCVFCHIKEIRMCLSLQLAEDVSENKSVVY